MCVQRKLNHFREVICAPTRTLVNLFATTESVRNDQSVRLAEWMAGNNTRSPIACAIWYFSQSNPNGPAIPQQPESRDVSSIPILRSKDSAWVIFMSAF